MLKEAKKQLILNDERQSIIHIFNHNYIVDGKTFIEEPIDVYADHLSHEMTFITMPKNNLNNLRQVFIDCDIEIERFISSTFALGVKLLSESEFQFGSILLDIGFEKVSLGLFKNFALVHSITFPIGINHLTKDISKVCSLSLAESENIKNNINFSFEDNSEMFDKNDYLKNSFFIDSNFRKISKSLILEVVKARLDEIFKMIKKQLLANKLNSKFTTNFFIVGGGSNLLNLEDYCSIIFKSKVKKLNQVNKEKKDDYKKKLSACLGALNIIKDGWETEAIPELVGKSGQKLSFFTKIFKNRL